MCLSKETLEGFHMTGNLCAVPCYHFIDASILPVLFILQ